MNEIYQYLESLFEKHVFFPHHNYMKSVIDYDYII